MTRVHPAKELWLENHDTGTLLFHVPIHRRIANEPVHNQFDLSWLTVVEHPVTLSDFLARVIFHRLRRTKTAHAKALRRKETQSGILLFAAFAYFAPLRETCLSFPTNPHAPPLPRVKWRSRSFSEFAVEPPTPLLDKEGSCSTLFDNPWVVCKHAHV